MLSYIETLKILKKFGKECYDFWIREGSKDKAAFMHMLRDIEEITHDPYIPCGKLLNEKAKADFIKIGKEEV